ncbi:catechol 2,3-dioxygenase-like lactoylglutathione lyase family enzyme [Bradyrhizobium sp. AZCC 2176]
MYDHIGLRVGDLDASVRFYTAALAPLGFVLCSRDDSGAGFGPKGEPALWLHLQKGSAGSAAHVAFRAKDHAAIKQFHAEGLKCRRSRQWRRRAARGLQPDLLRGVPDRP